jgi:hypothetical protein
VRHLLDFLTLHAPAVVIAALITAIVALRTGAQNIKVDNITKERAKWRDRIRCKALQVHQAAVNENTTRLQELYLEFTLLLSPNDPEDRSILNLIWQFRKEAPTESELRELAERISLLLKHDWERAKKEAKPLWLSVWPTRRVPYEEWLSVRSGRVAREG